MIKSFSSFLDRLSEFLAHRKGLLPAVGLLLVIANLLARLFFPSGWLAQTDLLLHLGVVLAVLGFLLAWAL